MSTQLIRKWCHHFQAGRTNVKDSLCSSWPKTSHTDEFKVKVTAHTEEDDLITIREITAAVGITYGTVRQIMEDLRALDTACTHHKEEADSRSDVPTKLDFVSKRGERVSRTNSVYRWELPLSPNIRCCCGSKRMSDVKWRWIIKRRQEKGD